MLYQLSYVGLRGCWNDGGVTSTFFFVDSLRSSWQLSYIGILLAFHRGKDLSGAAYSVDKPFEWQ